MATNLSATPIFYETLAAAAVCSPADAAEHFDALGNNDAERAWPVESFLEQYALPAPPAE
jgi:hypothetical protein